MIDGLDDRCPCCGGYLEKIEFVMGAEYGQFRMRPIACIWRCDLFYDAETKTWRDCQTWDAWDGVQLEPAQ